MTAYFESLQFEGFPLGETSRVKRLHSDRAREFTAPYFERPLRSQVNLSHFDHGLRAARALSSSGLDSSYWSYAVRYAAQSLICSALQRSQRSPLFGTTVVGQVVGHKDVRFPQSRSLTGRLLFWDHLQDQISYVLCAPEDDVSDPLVMWKTSDPQFLSSEGELQLSTRFYTEDFLKEYGPFVSARKRNTADEPDHFKKKDPEPPDLSNTDHPEWVKRGQRILGGLLWLSTRTRPDLACAVSMAAQVLTKDIHHC